MKKFFFLLLGFYVLLGAVFFFLHPSEKEYVTMITVKEELSRVLYENETLEINVFTDQPNAFLFDKEQFDSVYIESENFIFEVMIGEVLMENEPVLYHDKEYNQVRLKIVFDRINFAVGTEIVANNASIRIVYSNQCEISFEVGSIHLLIMDELNTPGLYLRRLYGVVDSSSTIGGLSGILVELKNDNETGIYLKSMDAFMDTVHFDNSNLWVLSTSENVYSIEDIENVLIAEYDSEEVFIEPGENKVLFLPFNKKTESFYFNRFPIVITYIHLNQSQQDVIDDFIYFSNQFTQLEVFENELSFARYYYD